MTGPWPYDVSDLADRIELAGMAMDGAAARYAELTAGEPVGNPDDEESS